MKKIIMFLILFVGIGFTQVTSLIKTIPADANNIRGSVLLRFQLSDSSYYYLDSLKVYITTPSPGSATSANQTIQITRVDSSNAIAGRIETNQTDNTQRAGLVSYISGGYGNISITTSADTLSGTSIPCAEVEITNNTAGTTLYVGYNASVTASNGFPLAYRDTYSMRISNLNKIYLIGSTTIDVRYIYNNY